MDAIKFITKYLKDHKPDNWYAKLYAEDMLFNAKCDDLQEKIKEMDRIFEKRKGELNENSNRHSNW